MKLYVYAGVAQSVEQLICNQQVGGSNPFASSKDEWIRKVRVGKQRTPKNTHSWRGSEAVKRSRL